MPNLQEVALLTSTTTDPRAWQADTIDEPDSWYYPLSERALSALDPLLQAWPRKQAVTDLRVSADVRAASR